MKGCTLRIAEDLGVVPGTEAWAVEGWEWLLGGVPNSLCAQPWGLLARLGADYALASAHPVPSAQRLFTRFLVVRLTVTVLPPALSASGSFPCRGYI